MYMCFSIPAKAMDDEDGLLVDCLFGDPPCRGCRAWGCYDRRPQTMVLVKAIKRLRLQRDQRYRRWRLWRSRQLQRRLRRQRLLLRRAATGFPPSKKKYVDI